MKKNILRLLLASCLFAVSCQKNTLTEEQASTTNQKKNSLMATAAETSAAASVNAYTNTSTYINSGFTFLNPTQVDKNRVAIGGSAYTEVYGFNIPEENRVRGIRWNEDDETTSIWRPQGIAGFSRNGVRYLLVSWYAKDAAESKGSRITLIDISPSSATYLTYRHILLVQHTLPTGTLDYTQYGTYAPLNVHAGGIAYFNGKVYLSSTSLGLRVFDLDKIIEVTTGTGTENKCGKDTNGNLYAFNYRYILPQIGYYKINDADPYSTVQVNYENNQLWTG